MFAEEVALMPARRRRCIGSASPIRELEATAGIRLPPLPGDIRRARCSPAFKRAPGLLTVVQGKIRLASVAG